MVSSDPLRLVGATLARKYAVDDLVRVEPSTVIYRATEVASNRSVGVRVLAAATALPEGRRTALGERLARDHRTLTELAELIPGAYPLRGVGSVRTPHGSVPFVVLDWPHGITLRQVVAQVTPESGNVASFPESIDGVVAMLEPCAVALAIAHENGVVHGGITSDRVLFREAEDGTRRATLLDFGVAYVLRVIETTRQGSANEKTREPTPADDVRALAAIVAQVMARCCGADARLDDARTPRERGVVVSDEIESVFVRALGEGTYPSVGELWSALRRALGLATLRSLEATIPPESPQVPSRSIYPLSRSTFPLPSRTVREAFIYGTSAFALLVVGGLTLERLLAADGHTPRRVAAMGGSAVRPACPQGTLALGGESIRLGPGDDADEPLHDVTLSRLCIDKDAVTSEAYDACTERGDCPPASATNEWDGITKEDHEVLDAFCTASGAGAEQRDSPRLVERASSTSRPVNCISWEMARTFCAKEGGRLPTEAEWEAASRITTASVAEWVADWRAPIPRGAMVDPLGPATGAERVVRGAHALGGAPTRFGAAPATRSHAIGFRCTRSP